MAFNEIIRAIFGVWRLFLIDKNGIHFFDNTRERTIRSFIVPAITYGIILLAIAQKSTNYEGLIPLHIALIIQGIGFSISLFGYFIATYYLIDYLEKKKEFMRYVQVSNWMTLVGLLLVLPIIFISADINPMIQFFFLILMIFKKIYDWFIVQSVFKIKWHWILLVLMIGEVIDALTSAMAYTIVY